MPNVNWRQPMGACSGLTGTVHTTKAGDGRSTGQSITQHVRPTKRSDRVNEHVSLIMWSQSANCSILAAMLDHVTKTDCRSCRLSAISGLGGDDVSRQTGHVTCDAGDWFFRSIGLLKGQQSVWTHGNSVYSGSIMQHTAFGWLAN